MYDLETDGRGCKGCAVALTPAQHLRSTFRRVTCSDAIQTVALAST